jgi:ligand-binding sensor domain-containing protein
MRILISGLQLFLGVAVLGTWPTIAAAESHTISMGLFPQEVPKQYTEQAGVSLVDAQSLYVDPAGQLHVRTPEHHWIIDQNSQWKSAPLEQYPLANQVLAIDDRLLLATDNGLVAWRDGQQALVGLEGMKVNAVAIRSDGRLAAATAQGLFESDVDQQWQPVAVFDAVGRMWAARDVRVVVYDASDQLWVGQPAGLACRTEAAGNSSRGEMVCPMPISPPPLRVPTAESGSAPESVWWAGTTDSGCTARDAASCLATKCEVSSWRQMVPLGWPPTGALPP